VLVVVRKGGVIQFSSAAWNVVPGTRYGIFSICENEWYVGSAYAAVRDDGQRVCLATRVHKTNV
jgi:hypothetical protein